MNNPNQELNDELSHEQKLLRLKTRNLRILEEQEANFGFDTPLHIKNQIALLKDQMKEHEDRLKRLQSQFVKDNMILAEAEYRMILAESWGNVHGHPTFVDQTRLEYARLRLDINLERTNILEQQVRSELSTEWIEFHYSDLMESEGFTRLLRWIELDNGIKWRDLHKSEDLKPLWKLAAIDPDHALIIILEEIHSSTPYDPNRIYIALSSSGPKDLRHSELIRSLIKPLIKTKRIDNP